jgi:Putative adhesin
MRCTLALILLALTACSSPAPISTTVGILQPGATMFVRVAAGTVNVFAPATGEPHNRFTISAIAAPKTTPGTPKMRPDKRGVTVDATDPLDSLLVRVPDGVNVDVDSRSGDVHVTNIAGNARVHAAHGNVQIILPGYVEAAVGAGRLSATMGATQWPGTLHLSTQTGDIELWVNENAKFHIRMHTANGTLFSDFNLRGSSAGTSETIDSDVNGGGPQAIDIETNAGAIRLLKLHPEA